LGYGEHHKFTKIPPPDIDIRFERQNIRMAKKELLWHQICDMHLTYIDEYSGRMIMSSESMISVRECLVLIEQGNEEQRSDRNCDNYFSSLCSRRANDGLPDRRDLP
jgi:hypothetical protein